MAAPKFKAFLKLFIKLAVTAICLWYVSLKIDWSKSIETITHSNVLWLLPAIILFATSKIVASIRLNIYFKNISVFLTEKVNLKLYWLGMFYNLFLPGGIGGDAYKVILLNKKYNHSAKLLSAAVLLDRISGVVGLAILGAVFYYLVYNGASYSLLILVTVFPAVLLFYFFVKIFFPSFVTGFWPALWLGLAVQLLQVFCAYTILFALHLNENESEYILIFLLSSIVAILPFTIGGFGAREIVFVWGSAQFSLNQNQSVSISITFYLITLVISFIGVYWVYKNPLENKKVLNAV